MISLELNLIPNQPVLIGVSGGIDSVCLLDLLQKKIEKKWIIVLHLNHQLRKEANSDEKFVCKLAEQYQIKVETKKVDVQHLTQNSSKGLELVAREQRHLFFSQMQEKYQAQALLLAHHADDQTETILYNLFRGSKGIKGIKKESILKVFDSANPQKKVRLKIIRPLLNYHKKQLLDYAIEYHLNYRKDKSNDLPITARNRLRNELLPLLCDIFNQSSDNFTLAKKVNRLWEDYRQLYERAINQIELTDFLDPQGRLFLPQWQEQNNLIKEHLIFQFLKKNKISNINQKMVHSCIQIASSKEQNLSTVNLPGNKYFKRREKRGIIV